MMFDTNIFHSIFLKNSDLSIEEINHITTNSLNSLDDGELFLEYVESEKLVFDDQKLKSSSFNISSGFGLRGISEEFCSYAYSSNLAKKDLNDAAKIIQNAHKGYNGHYNISQNIANKTKLYSDLNPLHSHNFFTKVELLKEIDSYIRSQTPLIKQVSISIMGEWQVVSIFRGMDEKYLDIRPLVRLNISVVLEKNSRSEGGSFGTGGRFSFEQLFDPRNWKNQADEALRQAFVNLESKPAPAGEMKVILGPGWPGVLLHEAVGHGLEGDFNRKKTSVFSDLMGKQVASKGVTVIDDGTIPNRRGSINIDDEGVKTEKTVLIEDGILCNYMQDRLNARLMNMKTTGNGRRESYAHQPMPRMTNTYMLSGNESPENIIASVKKGIYAPNFGGGQVDITSGKFVFSASEAYLVENGKISYPVKGATFIGNGPEILKKVTAIGNDMQLDAGVGTCGKNGQSVPVGVGQPTLLIDGMTVGGTEIS